MAESQLEVLNDLSRLADQMHETDCDLATLLEIHRDMLRAYVENLRGVGDDHAALHTPPTQLDVQTSPRSSSGAAGFCGGDDDTPPSVGGGSAGDEVSIPSDSHETEGRVSSLGNISKSWATVPDEGVRLRMRQRDVGLKEHGSSLAGLADSPGPSAPIVKTSVGETLLGSMEAGFAALRDKLSNFSGPPISYGGVDVRIGTESTIIFVAEKN